MRNLIWRFIRNFHVGGELDLDMKQYCFKRRYKGYPCIYHSNFPVFRNEIEENIRSHAYTDLPKSQFSNKISKLNWTDLCEIGGFLSYGNKYYLEEHLYINPEQSYKKMGFLNPTECGVKSIELNFQVELNSALVFWHSHPGTDHLGFSRGDLDILEGLNGACSQLGLTLYPLLYLPLKDSVVWYDMKRF